MLTILVTSLIIGFLAMRHNRQSAIRAYWDGWHDGLQTGVDDWKR